MKALIITALMFTAFIGTSGQVQAQPKTQSTKTRVIATSDGEIDDQCSMVRFLLYTNEWDVEGIITSSSQYHSHIKKWPGDHWVDPYLEAYAKVYPNLLKHDKRYPSPIYLRKRTLLGNVETQGEMTAMTPGADLITKVLLNDADKRPIWLLAWGGTNTIARALKTIEERHPEKMGAVANKMRFYLIWEQDSTYQTYIKPHWGKYNIPTIIADQFEAIAYRWAETQPEEMHPYFQSAWMKQNILENHGPLTAIYQAMPNGDFRSEGDSPSFIYLIPTGLRSMESPSYGGWGGRFVKVRANTWLDSVLIPGYQYPDGRWFSGSSWGRLSVKQSPPATHDQVLDYFKQMWRWSDALQNDFAARADWCVKSYKDANHPPVINQTKVKDATAKPGSSVKLSVAGSTDPDGNKLSYHWYVYPEPSNFIAGGPVSKEAVEVQNADKAVASVTVPKGKGSLHFICAVTDNGKPALTRYARIIINVKP
ncbi:DUF1593 domain-containing protein [Mucilaginibacter mali]|uniref:DUF1593 domain-containing protein n=1 Tax=Mucilaginibacter mali TaxID=2740462 RepID=A0A7D4QBT0_9SPHI|nr:DUF1593 domain-containing protein [Mucilaginibacter mali]QKJ30724.1 DUF1593 domain-containing protein [Mucilaginibacter mali]